MCNAKMKEALKNGLSLKVKTHVSHLRGYWFFPPDYCGAVGQSKARIKKHINVNSENPNPQSFNAL